jgi:hypothetical protein
MGPVILIEIPQKTYYELWYQDLDKIINEFYGIETYECLDNIYDNFKNDMYDVWDTSGEWTDEDELSEWLEDKVGEIHPATLLHDMAEKGHIPHGKYLIHIWW